MRHLLIPLGIITGLLSSTGTRAGNGSITLKAGEPSELVRLYATENCKNVAKMPPRVEIIAGPPGFSLTVQKAKVVPVSAAACKAEVDGAIVYLTAKDVNQPTADIVVQWKYDTGDGVNKSRGRRYAVTITP